MTKLLVTGIVMLYVAHFDGKLMQDNDEVSEVKWIGLKELGEWMSAAPDDFTQGFLLTYGYYMKRGGIIRNDR